MPDHTAGSQLPATLASNALTVDYLPNRRAVIARTVSLLESVNSEWIGMGRTAAWIKLPAFAAAVSAARARGAEFKVVVFFEGDADLHASTWRSIGADVRFFEHGYMRLLIFDDNDAIIAFPKSVLSLLEDREYFGFHLRGERSTSDLRGYFQQIWEDAEQYPGADAGQSNHEVFAAGIVRFIARVIERASLGS